MRRAPHIWTVSRQEIFWEGVTSGKSNGEIARLTGLTRKQIANKRQNEIAHGTDDPDFDEWTRSDLESWNTAAVELLRKHHNDMEGVEWIRDSRTNGFLKRPLSLSPCGQTENQQR